MITTENEIRLNRNDLSHDKFIKLHQKEGCNVQTMTVRNKLPEIVHRYVCTRHHVVSLMFVTGDSGNLPYKR